MDGMRDPRRLRLGRRIFEMNKGRQGWGGTGLKWHPQLGPINPAADQPVPRWPKSIPAAHPKTRRLAQLLRTSHRLQAGQRSPGNTYRKTVGRSLTFTSPDKSPRRA